MQKFNTFVKNLNKLEIRKKINSIKNQKLTAAIISLPLLTLILVSQITNKAMMFALTTCIQHCTGKHNQCNKM